MLIWGRRGVRRVVELLEGVLLGKEELGRGRRREVVRRFLSLVGEREPPSEVSDDDGEREDEKVRSAVTEEEKADGQE